MPLLAAIIMNIGASPGQPMRQLQFLNEPHLSMAGWHAERAAGASGQF
jgi:hypothetical protein